jgi:hypothetical protein
MGQNVGPSFTDLRIGGPEESVYRMERRHQQENEDKERHETRGSRVRVKIGKHLQDQDQGDPTGNAHVLDHAKDFPDRKRPRVLPE